MTPDRRPDSESEAGADVGSRATGAPERLQKLLAAAGLGSRRSSEELIEQGRVTVDGAVAGLGDKVVPTDVVVAVDGQPVNVNPELVHLMVNKPRGVVTTLDDPHGRRTVGDIVDIGGRVFPVGRLDMDSQGLLIMTNDGDLAHALMHPSYEVERTYVAQVDGRPGGRQLKRLQTGVELDDGTATAISARVLGEGSGKSLVEVVLAEGRNREVRRMFSAVGIPLERLARVAYGGIELHELRPGSWRPLTRKEIGRLYDAAGMGPAPAPGSRLFGAEDRSA